MTSSRHLCAPNTCAPSTKLSGLYDYHSGDETEIKKILVADDGAAVRTTNCYDAKSDKTNLILNMFVHMCTRFTYAYR